MKIKNAALAILAIGLVTPALAWAQQKEKASAKVEGTLTMNASLSHRTIPNYKSSEVYASVKVHAKEFVSEARAPLNLSLVIDRSSSMSGEKIAQARAAAKKLVDTLVPGDRLSIVSYSNGVSVDVTPMEITDASRLKFYRAIDKIQPNGFTNLSGGFEKGCELVSNTIQEESVNRVILMSDGQANRGITSIHQLERMASECLEKGVSLTTVGLGLDYNEDLMAQMARGGAGNYHFIDDESQMAAVFQTEATGLASTVATKAKLEVELAPGVELLKVHGYKYSEKGTTVTIPLSEFISTQRKEIVMKLSVSAQEKGVRPIAGMKLRYKDELNARRAVASAKLSTSVSADEKVIARRVNKKVISHAQKVEVADSMQRAMVEYERGNQEEAAKIIDQQQAVMNSNRAAYGFEDDSAYESVDQELSQMKQEVKKNKPSSAAGKKMRKSKKKRAYDISGDSDLFGKGF